MSDELTSIEPHDFAASVLALIEDGGVEDAPAEDTATTAPEVAETTEPELKADERGNLHGPDGKFVEKGTEEGEQEQETEEETDEETPEGEQSEDTVDEWELDVDDPDIAALLSKYDNDLGKALKGAAEAQKMVGRQGSELGELRQLQGKVETLEQMLAAQAARPATPAVDYTSLIEDDPKRAAHVAMQNGDVDAMVAAVSEWADSGEPRDAFEAATFLNGVLRGYEMDQLRAEMKENQTPAPAVATSDAQEAAKVLQKHPDLEKFLPEIGQVAQERPLLKQALESGSPQEKAIALEDAYLIARSRSDADTSADAVKRVRVRAAEEGQKARADAAVVSASRGSAASADQPTKADQFLDAFDQHLRAKGLMGSDE